MKKTKTALYLKITAFTLFFVLSLFPLLACLFPYSPPDVEYALHKASGEIITREYPIEPCHKLYFFYNDYTDADKLSNLKITSFTNAVPEIKIINDIEYYVELTTESSIHDAISMNVANDTLDICIQDQYYNRVHEDDPSYDYDSGLYVDCSVFDITIHAPVYTFCTETQTSLDFDAPQTHELILRFSYFGTQADIHNIDVSELFLTCSGNSDITVSGTVSGNADINLWHNVHVDARRLTAGSRDTYISSQLFGSSFIRWADGIEFNTPDSYNTLSVLISVILTAFPVLWLCLDIKFIHRLINSYKEQ